MTWSLAPYRPGSSLVPSVLRGALLAGSYCPLPPSLFLRSRLLNCHFLARCSPEPEAQPHLDSLPSLPRNPVLFFESQAAIQLLEWRTIDGNGMADNTIRYPVWSAHSQSCPLCSSNAARARNPRSPVLQIQIGSGGRERSRD